MSSLYRKYRPQTFAEVVGQKYIVQTLRNQVALGQIAHAYLFCGSRGVGKTSLARIFAKAVNCLNSKQQTVDSRQSGDACGQCSLCKAIENNNFIDLVEVDAASNTGVDNVRELIEHVKFSPSVGKYKVFIVDEVHMLSKGAFNALLKTLEEPPSHTIFILATTETAKVPATIVSRCQKFDFKRFSESEVAQQVKYVCKQEKVELEEKIVHLISQHAEGSLRDGLSLLDKVLSLGQNPSLKDAQILLGSTDIALSLELFSELAYGKSENLPDFFTNLEEQGVDFLAFNKDFLEMLRILLVFKTTNDQKHLPWEEIHNSNFLKISELVSLANAMFFMRLFLRAYKEFSASLNPYVPLLLASIECALKQASLLVGGLEEKKNLNSQPNLVTETKIYEEVTNAPEKRLHVSIEEFLANWQNLTNAIKEINSPLGTMLKNYLPDNISEGYVELSVNFLFHKQSLENSKNQTCFSEACQKIVGQSFKLKPVFKNKSLNSTDNATLGDALKIFGGEIIK